MKIIAFIPARSGSKRIKNKNIYKINGKPMISHVIKMLKNTKIFKSIVVSTDSKKIERIALKAGAEVPFLRNKNLSDDKTTIMEVVKDYCLSIKSSKKFILMCIFPTSILISEDIIKKGIKTFAEKKCDFLICIKKFNHPIERSFKINKKKMIETQLTKNFLKNTQTFKNRYHDLGQFYIGTSSNWRNKKHLISKNTMGIDLSNHNIFDIDEINDLKLVNLIFLNNLKNAEKK